MNRQANWSARCIKPKGYGRRDDNLSAENEHNISNREVERISQSSGLFFIEIDFLKLISRTPATVIIMVQAPPRECTLLAQYPC